MVSSLTFRFLIHFEFNSLYGMRKCSNFILLQELFSFLSIISWRDCIKFIDEFLVASLEISMYNMCHLFYFSLSNLGFSSFYCLTAVAKTSSTMLYRTGESGHPCLVPDFSRKVLSFSSFSIILAVGMSEMASLMLRCVPSKSTLVKVFLMDGCWILLNTFSASIEMVVWFLIFVNVVY